MRPKLNYEYVKGFFSQQGCDLLELHYINAKTNMQYRCSCGNVSKINWNNFQQGQRCRKCSYEKTANAKRLKHEDVAQLFLQHGCELLTDFVVSSQKVKYKCSCGTISETLVHNFKKGVRCKNCKRASISGSKNYQWITDRGLAQAKKLFRAKCYSLIRNTLKAVGTKKLTKTYALLGYTANELQQHICKHPNWRLVCGNKWDVDHIFPIQAFVEHGISDIKLINCLENLRPILASENRSKNCKYDRNEFLKWLNIMLELEYLGQWPASSVAAESSLAPFVFEQ
jgi:hypothetical protein